MVPLCWSRFYGALLGTVCMLYLLPLCWVLALLNSTLFLGNVEFFRKCTEHRGQGCTERLHRKGAQACPLCSVNQPYGVGSILCLWSLLQSRLAPPPVTLLTRSKGESDVIHDTGEHPSAQDTLRGCRCSFLCLGFLISNMCR